MEITKQDNIILNIFKGKLDTTKKQIEIEVKRQKFYKEAQEIKEKRMRTVLDYVHRTMSRFVRTIQIHLWDILPIVYY